MAGLGKYSTGGYGRIGVYRVNYGEGGLQNWKIVGPKFVAPPSHQDRVILSMPPLLNSAHFLHPPLTLSPL